MNRWSAVVVGAVLMGLIGVLVWKSGGGSVSPSAAPATSADSPVKTESNARDASPALLDPFLALKLEGDGGLAALGPAGETADPKNDLGQLPSGSPKTVRFGVILVQYKGAELAPATARTKKEAAALAHTLAEAAGTDFKAQVHKGDPGSMEDAGRIQRGVLEPSVEYALFMLPRGSVSEPIDTPRGFWIVRRIE
jgi:hypothetical protein